jgi:RimJ/RimL family protein N-acetyltransferase
MWAVTLKISGKLIGRCGLFDSVVDGQGETELSYLIDPDVAGHGFATEAAASLIEHGRHVIGLTRIIALIHPENTASIRVAEKLGFHYESERSELSEFGSALIYALALP